MDIISANEKVKFYEKEIKRILVKKEIVLLTAFPKSSKITEEVVSQSRTSKNKFLYEIIENEELDFQLDYCYMEKENLTKFIENELKRMKKYKEIMNLIIFYREHEKLKWETISQKTKYSETQCRQIYRDYKQKRDID